MIGVVCGLKSEAAIARASTVRVAIGAGRPDLAEKRIQNVIDQGVSGLLSFGTAGALDQNLHPGGIVVATGVIDASGRSWAVDVAYRKRLITGVDGALSGPVLGMDTPVLRPADKAVLWKSTGAIATDMESHLVARLAVENGLPFAVLRAIVDDARMCVPAGLAAAIDKDGESMLAPILGDLFSGRVTIGQLISLWRAFSVAKGALLRSRAALLGLAE